MTSDLKTQLDIYLAEGYLLWTQNRLPVLSEPERYLVADVIADVYRGPHKTELAAACQCFFLYRKLHGMADQFAERATLLGDWFFSQFSRYLIPIDSVELIDAFSEYLSEDTQTQGGRADYISFVRSLAVRAS